MGTVDLSLRFTEDHYSSRREVSEALGTSLIDPIWKNILLYRSKFQHHLGLYDISKASYSITYSLNVVNKINALKAKLSRMIVSFGKLESNSIQRYTIRREALKDALRNVALNNSIIVNDVALENILDSKSVNEDFQILVDYISAIRQLEAKPIEPIDENLLAQYYALLNGEEELTSFYRTSDFKASSQKLVIGREYVCAPANTIENLMKNLLDYIALNGSKDYLSVAVAAFYQINYIKPFAKYNEEMSILLLKAILSSASELRSIASIIPFEALIGEFDKKIRIQNREVQRSRDLTYILLVSIECLDEVVSKILDLIVVKEKTEAKEVYYSGDDDEAYLNEFGVPRQKSELKVESEKVEVKVSEPVEIKKPVIEQIQKVEPVMRPIVEERQSAYIDEYIDEKVLRRQEVELLESDPALRPHMAHFYVRHNKFGRFYTIQQYKKSERTVYETARTAMDTLAKRGYYRRERLKNKFVYTPIKK